MATVQHISTTGRVLTLPEFCAKAGISRRFFYILKERGEAPASVRIGRKRGVLEATADAWLKSREA